MADDKQIYQNVMAGYEAALLEQHNAYQQARIMDDSSAQVEAAMNMADIRARRAEFNNMAREAMTPRSASAPVNKYGLTQQEVETAHASHSYGTKEEREQSYAMQKDKLRRMRASGEYRQTTDQTG